MKMWLAVTWKKIVMREKETFLFTKSFYTYSINSINLVPTKTCT